MSLKPLPLLMAIEYLQHHDDDRREYLLRVGVVAADTPLTATVETQSFEDAKVVNVGSNGGLTLPEEVRDRFLLACFDALEPSVRDVDIGSLPFDDATAWIRANFSPADASSLLTELGKQVKPALDFHPLRSSPFIPLGRIEKRGWHYVR